VQAYAPQLNKGCRPYLKPVNKSYRIDETYIKVKGEDKFGSENFATKPGLNGTPGSIRTADLLLRREKLDVYVLHSTVGPARL